MQPSATAFSEVKKCFRIQEVCASLCVWRKSDGACVFIRVCVASSQLEGTKGKVLIKCMKGTVQVHHNSTFICSYRTARWLTHLGIIIQARQSDGPETCQLLGSVGSSVCLHGKAEEPKSWGGGE